jgi:O-antigen ligase
VPSRLHASALAAAAVFILPLTVLAPNAVVPLLVLAGLCAIPGGRPALTPTPAVRATLALLAALAAWAFASTLWSVAPAASLRSCLSAVGLGALGLVLLARARRLDAASRRRVATGIIGGVASGIVLLEIEIVTNGGLTAALRSALGDGERPPELVHLNRAATALALLVWPAALALLERGERAATAVLVTAAALILVQLQSLSAMMALAVSALCFGAVWRFRGRGRIVLAAVAVAGLAAAPLLPLTALSPETVRAAGVTLPFSSEHRLHIWRFAAERTLERPLCGWGVRAYRALPEAPELAAVTHPHNAFLELWVELGFVGAALAGALLFLVFLPLAPAVGPPVVQAGYAAAVVAPLLVGNTAFGLWQSMWVATAWLHAALLALALPSATTARPADAGPAAPARAITPPRSAAAAERARW